MADVPVITRIPYHTELSACLATVNGAGCGAAILNFLPAASANMCQATRDEAWFRTGDIGYVDGDGFLYLAGRSKELINRGGEMIAPVEIDRVLLSHPAVAEAAAFGVADGRLGEDVVAAVVLKPGATASARELRGWMLDRLSLHKVPRRLWFVAQLPRTPSGKVQRGDLAARWTEAQR